MIWRHICVSSPCSSRSFKLSLSSRFLVPWSMIWWSICSGGLILIIGPNLSSGYFSRTYKIISMLSIISINFLFFNLLNKVLIEYVHLGPIYQILWITVNAYRFKLWKVKRGKYHPSYIISHFEQQTCPITLWLRNYASLGIIRKSILPSLIPVSATMPLGVLLKFHNLQIFFCFIHSSPKKISSQGIKIRLIPRIIAVLIPIAEQISKVTAKEIMKIITKRSTP